MLQPQRPRFFHHRFIQLAVCCSLLVATSVSLPATEVELHPPNEPTEPAADAAGAKSQTGEAAKFELKTIEESDDDGNVVERFRAKVYEDGRTVKHGKFQAFGENNKAIRDGAYEDGARSGYWTYYDENQVVVKEGAYNSGKLEGEWNFYVNQTKIRSENYRDGAPHGRWVRYSTESQMVLETREYENGNLHGTLTTTYLNGQPRLYASFSQGKLHGERKTWHANGRQASIEHFRNGKRHGSQMKWSANGYVTQNAVYNDDELVRNN